MPALRLRFTAPDAPLPPDDNRPAVHWRAFLLGSATVNPLRDLVDRLVYRLERPARLTPAHANRLDFRPDFLLLMAGEEEEVVFAYDDMSGLQFHTKSSADMIATCTVRFVYPTGAQEFQTTYANRELHKVLVFLLEQRVPFREFQDGSRVHLGEGKSYAQIQELKKTYGIVW